MSDQMRRFVAVAALAATQFACSTPPSAPPIVINGSSTLVPLTRAVVADFTKSHRGMSATLAEVGTVEGFDRFCRGELDILDASRSVTADEQTACESGHVTFIELPVAQDALTVIVSAGN